jgi:hypothetical protein
MKLLGARPLSVMLVGTLLFCHGIFGGLHLICYSPQCAGDAEHAAEHHVAAGAMAGEMGGAHEHPADHGISAGYFAVLAVGLLGLFLRALPERAQLRISLSAHWPVIFRRVPAALRPPPTPTPLTLQVFRL